MLHTACAKSKHTGFCAPTLFQAPGSLPSLTASGGIAAFVNDVGVIDPTMCDKPSHIAMTMTSALTKSTARAQADLYDAVFNQGKLFSVR